MHGLERNIDLLSKHRQFRSSTISHYLVVHKVANINLSGGFTVVIKCEQVKFFLLDLVWRDLRCDCILYALFVPIPNMSMFRKYFSIPWNFTFFVHSSIEDFYQKLKLDLVHTFLSISITKIVITYKIFDAKTRTNNYFP